MALTVLQDNSLYNAAGNFGHGIGALFGYLSKEKQQQDREQQLNNDYQNLLQSSMQGMNAVPLGMQNLVNIQSPQVQQSLMSMLVNQLMPQQVSPLEQAQIANYQSQIEERTANLNKPEPLSPINVGGKLAFADKSGNVMTTNLNYGTPDATKWQAINSGDKLLMFNPETQELKETPYASSKVPSTTVNVNPASASEREAIASNRASIDALDNLKSLFDDNNTQTGPIYGRYANIAGLVGATTPQQESFMAATSAFKNAVIKEITGAQMSEVEAQRIMKQVPDITDPPERWKAKWQQTKKNLEAIQQRKIEVLQQSGLKAPVSEKTNELDAELRKRGLLP